MHSATVSRAANGVASSEEIMMKERKDQNGEPILFTIMPFLLDGLSGKLQQTPLDIREGATLRQRSGVSQTEKSRRLCSSTVAKPSGDTSKEKVTPHQHYGRAEFVSTLVLGD